MNNVDVHVDGNEQIMTWFLLSHVYYISSTQGWEKVYDK